MQTQVKRITQYLPLLVLLLVFGSCEKDPGSGGTSTIKGKVVINEISNSGSILSAYDGAEERVYIIYGDNEIYDDVVRASYDGQFKFDNLFKGTYTVFVYSECMGCPGGIEPVMQTIEVSDNGETYTFPEDFISNNN